MDLPEDIFRHGYFSQLESGLPGMANDARPELDKSVLYARERPVGHLFGQLDALQETAKIVGEGMKLKADLVIAEPHAR